MIKYNNRYYGIDVLCLLKLMHVERPQLFRSIESTSGNIMTNCPFHGADNKPSFGIREKDGLCHCLACGYKSSMTGFINKLGFEHLFDEREVVEADRKVELPKKESKEIISLDNPYKKFKTLYWQKRGITKEIKDLFELGYDSLNKSVTFPLKTESGRIIGFIRRSVEKKQFHVDKGVEKILYGMYELGLTKYKRCSIIITESNIDALYLWSLGYPSIALNGTGSQIQYDLINKTDFRVLYLMLDNDNAGRKGTKRLKDNVFGKVFKTVNIPKGYKDANDLDKNTIDFILQKTGYKA